MYVQYRKYDLPNVFANSTSYESAGFQIEHQKEFLLTFWGVFQYLYIHIIYKDLTKHPVCFAL